jgi:hypothetical protein
MYPLKKSISLALGLVILAAVAVVMTAGKVGASPTLNSLAAASTTPSIPVAVTNTPLPVSIAGTPTVNANIGTPNVNINGTPTVNVNSSATAPVYVDADRSARNGFNASCFTGNVDPTYGQASCTLLTIPAGRQIVIETISCQAELYAGHGPGDVQLIVPNTPFAPGMSDHVSHLLTLTKQAGDATLDIWRMTSPLRAYGSAPAQGSVDVGVFFRADPTLPGPQDMICTISGYAVGQ